MSNNIANGLIQSRASEMRSKTLTEAFSNEHYLHILGEIFSSYRGVFPAP